MLKFSVNLQKRYCKCCDTIVIHLITDMATKQLARRSCTQPGYAGREDSRPGRMGWDGRFHHVASQNGTRFKSYELCISGIFHLIFSECG